MFSLLMYVIVSLPLAFAFDKEIGQHLCQYDLSVDACFVVVGDDFGLVLVSLRTFVPCGRIPAPLIPPTHPGYLLDLHHNFY